MALINVMKIKVVLGGSLRCPEIISLLSVKQGQIWLQNLFSNIPLGPPWPTQERTKILYQENGA